MNKSQKKAGVIISYATELVKVLTSLFYTPIMLRLLGSSEYGLYHLVHSVVAYLGLLSLGFGSAYMRFYSRSSAKGDKNEIARLNGMFLTIFSIISVICLLCGSAMVLHAERIFGAGLTAEELKKAKVLMGIMVVNLALTFPNTVFNNFVTAHERFLFQKALLFFQSLLNPFLTLPLLLLGYGSVGMVLVSTALTAAVLLLNLFFCIAKLKIRFSFSGFEWGLFREMFAFTFFLFLNQIIDQINWSVDKFLLGRMISTTAVAIYSTGSLLNTLYIQMSTSVSNVFVPQIHRIVSGGNDDKLLTEVFARVGRMQFLVLALVMSGIVFFGQSFIRMWAIDGYDNAYYVAILLVIPETVPLIQNIGIEIQRAKNKHKTRSVVYFFMAIANVFISIPLIGRFAEIGAAAGTTISLVVANICFMNWYYQKRIGLDLSYFWNNILSMCKGLIAPVILGTFILLYVNTNGLSRFILWAAAYTVVYAISMWLFGMNDDEKRIVRSVYSRFIKKRQA